MAFTKIETPLQDCYIIEPQVFSDTRGFFMETYSQKEFEKIGVFCNFVQDNHSMSKAWVLRGLHFQTWNMQQAKLVRVISGSVYDIAVDLRKSSPTFGKWFWVILSAENKKQLFIPKGFAHGFLTLEDNTEFVYKCDEYYSKEFEMWIQYNDIKIWISWKEIMMQYNIKYLEISEKDKDLFSFDDYLEKYND